MSWGMQFGSSEYYELFRTNQMHFWVWGVVVCHPPSYSLAHVSSSFFLLFDQHPHWKFRSIQSAKQTTFFFFSPNQGPTSWLHGMTLLPNMHEYVMVCLELISLNRRVKARARQRSPWAERPWQLHKLFKANRGACWENFCMFTTRLFLIVFFQLITNYKWHYLINLYMCTGITCLIEYHHEGPTEEHVLEDLSCTPEDFCHP